MEYEPRPVDFEASSISKFSGEPSAAIGQAWKELMERKWFLYD